MPVKVLCPKCGSEIHDPSNLKNVVCPSCTFTFDFGSEKTVVSPPPVVSGTTPRRVAEPPPARIGKYEILGEISRGGMGIVYKANQRDLDRAVALKVVNPDLAEFPEFIERFFREAKALAKLNHPNIVQIHDVDRDGANLFLVMELVEGRSLRAMMKAGRIPPAEVLRLTAQVCDALDYAHHQGIVHRDIKPENILVTRRGEVKVADFGLAVLFTTDPNTPRLTQSNAILGTYDYMSPEQRQATANVDHRADLFSLGVVLYELLTGKLPVGRFEAPSKIAGTSLRLDDAIFKALEPDPEKRWSRAKEIRDAVAPPPPVPARGDWKKMNVPWLAAAGLCAIVLVAMWLTAWQVKRNKLEARTGGGERISEAPALGHLRIGGDRQLTGTNAKTLEEYFSPIAPGSTVDVEIDPSAPAQRQKEVLEAATARNATVRFVAGETRVMKLHLEKGQKLRVEDYTVFFWDRVDNVGIYDRRGVEVVEFMHFKRGDVRRWQDLQLTFEHVSKEAITVEAELKPGAPCFGSGAYFDLRSGLRVEFPENRSFTILEFDAAKVEMKVAIEGSGKTEERALKLKSEARIFGIYYRLLKDEESGKSWLV